jgi:hypothetical protein
MHELSGGLVLGYHGCDKEVGEQLLDGEDWRPSANDWDWLGPGVYFWEANPKRGFDFACELRDLDYKHTKVTKPFVVGAVINPRLCLDLTTKAGCDIVSEAYSKFAAISAKAKQPLPDNSRDLLRRHLDCQVIRYVHLMRQDANERPADTVRGVFIEGDPIYPKSGFYAKTHVQIAVRNLDCIKGVFRVSKHLYE